MENALIEQPMVSQLDGDPNRRPKTAALSESKPSGRRIDRRGLLMIALLLGASGAYRYWRDFQFATIEAQSQECPFPLKDVPTVLGNWRMVEGAESTLDPQIARIAGSSAHIVRVYERPDTGEKATVLVLYGPADQVWNHTPDVCYPATGYRAVSPSRVVTIPGRGTSSSVPFREGVYTRSLGGVSATNQAYHSFRNAGAWTPDMANRWKQFRYNPGMFKVQVERTLNGAGDREHGCDEMLSALVAEIDERIAGSTASH